MHASQVAKSGPMNETVGQYVRDPQWFPHAYYPHSDSFEFCHLSREMHRDAVFLDPRFLSRAKKSPPIPASYVEAVDGSHSSGEIHFVFHTGFCGSTLLARALDQPGVSMGLKEPHVLQGFASQWAQMQRTPGAMLALRLAIGLLARPLGAGEVQVVKANNGANHIIPEILCLRPHAKALFMGASLGAFLRAIMRRGQQGRLFARALFHTFSRVIPPPTAARDEFDGGVLQSDLEVAAHAWVLQKAFMDAIARRFGEGRVRIVSADAFIEDAPATLTALASFFRLGDGSLDWATAAKGPLFQEHAKERGRVFNKDHYLVQRDETPAAHADEFNAALRWGCDLTERHDVSLAWDETLLRMGAAN